MMTYSEIFFALKRGEMTQEQAAEAMYGYDYLTCEQSDALSESDNPLRDLAAWWPAD